MADEFRVNFDEPRERANFFAAARSWTGKKRITVVADRARRTDRQNRYYWPCFVQPFGDYLRRSKPAFTDEMAHEVLKKLFLEESVCDEETGEVFTYVRSTTELSIPEFNQYLDRVAELLMDHGFRVPDPNTYREREEAAA